MSAPHAIDAPDVRAPLARKALADARQRAAAARLLGLGETDVLAIQHLAWSGALAPSRLGERLRLTSGGMTALIQRLERSGHVTREPHPHDARSTLLRLTEQAEHDVGRLYAPLVRDLDRAAAALDPATRAAVGRFMDTVAELAERHAAALAQSADAERPPVPAVPTPGLWS